MTAGLLLQCRRVEAGYGSSQVLFGVDLDVHEGEVVTLLGRNGMGKSTLVKTIVSLRPLRAGEIQFGNRSLAGLRPDQTARLGIAIVPEGRRVFGNLTVAEHLVAFARPGVGRPWSTQRLYALFPRLRERVHHLGRQLSGGEQQMLAIARALSTNPRLLILDEATEGLAPVIRADIWRCLKQLRETGQTILVTDKYVDALLAFADRHVIVEKGTVAWSGTGADLKGPGDLMTRYLGV